MTHHACSLRLVTRRCLMLKIGTPILLEGRAVSDGAGSSGHATNPPPRVSWWHERRGLLASGLHSPSRFPSGSRVEGLAIVARLPVTVAGPRRSCTGFRVAPFV